MRGIPFDLPGALALGAGDLDTTFVGGTAYALSGTAELHAALTSTFDAASASTSIGYRFEVCDGDPDDEDDWTPIVGRDASTGEAYDPDTGLVFATVAGTTVKGRMITTSHGGAKFVRVAALRVGVTSGDDAASSSLRVIP
jgi:hypothetical protein